MIWPMRAHRQTLRTVAFVFVIAALLGGCGVRVAATDPTALRAHHPDSGIRGRVLAGPTCPVQRVGHPCVRPYQATIAIRSGPTSRLAARVRSSATGRFTVALAPGRYLVVPQTGRPYPRSPPQTATVHPHRYTSVLISYDTASAELLTILY